MGVSRPQKTEGSERDGVGGGIESQAAGERAPPGGFIGPQFRQGLISEQ